MREFKSVSASQISNYRDCARKWWYQSILGLQTPQNASAALGEAVHAQLEAYLNDGDYPDTAKTAGRIAEAGLNLLPAPGTVFTEVPMHGTDRNKKEPGADDVPLPGAMPRLFVAGMPVNGYIDVLDVSADSPVVLDHKTTGDLKWAKTEADLREDVQMVLYGSYALDVVASMGVQADTVTAGHIVYLTKGAPLAKATKVTLTRDHLALERKKIAETVEEMKVSAKARTPDAVTGEPSSCSKFGGCHFKDKCAALGALSNIEIPSFIRNATPVPTPVHANPQQESPTMSNVDPLAALAALRAKKAAAAAAAPVEAPVTPAAPAEVPAASAAVAAPATVTGKSAEVLAKYGIKNAAATATPTAPSIVPSDTPPQSRPSFATPAATPAPAPAVEAVEDSEAKATRKPKNYQTKLTALNWTEAQISRMNAEAMRAAIDGNLDGRAYSVTPTGSIHIPGEGRLDTSTVPWKDDGFESEEEAKQFYATFPEEAPKAAPVAAPAEKVPAAVAAPVAPAAPTLVLYIDCSPEKGRERDYVLLEDFIQPMLPLVTEAYNRGCKKDDEKVPFYSLIPYARGPGFVAALVMQQPPTGVIVANTRFPATNAVLEVLIPMADVVVRGTR
jgi:RecB family exonuclease